MRWVGLLLFVAVARGGEKELRRDDGKRAGRKSNAGTGHVVFFDAPKGNRWWVAGVAIHGARYGSGYDPKKTEFTVTVCERRLRSLGSSVDATYDLFPYGRFEWTAVALGEPVAVSGRFAIVVEFSPTATKGVFVGYSDAKDSHSGTGVPGGRIRELKGREWMIRVRLTNRPPRKPKRPKAGRYLKDFEYIEKTVRRRFPAFRKKGIDWKKVCAAWRSRFAACRSDEEHVGNVQRLLATLQDSHTGVVGSHVKLVNPAFDGLFGGGLWIAADQGRLVVRHSLREDIEQGWLLESVGGKPAAEAHAAARAKVREWQGWSSTHFLDARLSFQFFDFGDRRRLEALFLDAEGNKIPRTLERWGPGGKGVSRIRATMQQGVAHEPGAVSKVIGTAGYLRITGAMDDPTQKAFFRAFDALKGVEAILLDCRGMGGGGDGPAWAMTGRFGVPKPTGPWQFKGPVVMLIDERMISSAETFTWALAETGRALLVGRPTGGATIIPQLFRAPSGLFRFRLGVHDRKTPVKRIQPEGIGWPPDILVRYQPDLLRRQRDPIADRGMQALGMLMRGNPRRQVVAELQE